MADDKSRIEAALATARVPGLPADPVSLGMVSDVQALGGIATLTVRLTPAQAALQQALEAEMRRALAQVRGVSDVAILFKVEAEAPKPATKRDGAKGIRHLVAVGSGKGGVGKSTVTINLALALAARGLKVGVLDADIYGPSVPPMLGVADVKPEVADNRLVPVSAHGLVSISMGNLLPERDAPVIWRGPMIGNALRQLLGDVAWGELDLLLIDLPPGTGDVPLTLVQGAPLTGAVIVLTPQPVAIDIGLKTLRMFQQTKTPVLGLVENMSHFSCPACGHDTPIFDQGGGEAVAEREGVGFLGAIPLDPVIRQGGDAGKPVVAAAPESPQARAFVEAADRLWAAVQAASAAPV